MDPSSDRAQREDRFLFLFVLIHSFPAKHSLTQWLHLILFRNKFAKSIVHCHFFRNRHVNTCLRVKSCKLEKSDECTF